MTPEQALGRLVNLREQLTAIPAKHDSPSSNLTITPTQYCEIIDDLDDIIRSIERGMKEPEDDRDEDEHRGRRKK